MQSLKRLQSFGMKELKELFVFIFHSIIVFLIFSSGMFIWFLGAASFIGIIHKFLS